MPLRVLLDEHISPQVAYRLNQIGFDVVPVRDRGLLDWDDWDLMKWCMEHRFAICTQNLLDFEREDRRCHDRGEVHEGVFIIGGDWSQDAIYWALRQYLEEHALDTEPLNSVVRLLVATPQFIQARTGSASP